MTDQFSQLLASKIRAAFGQDAALHSLTPLAGDASSRRYYRALLRGSGIPKSVIVMELPAGAGLPLSSEELAIFKEGPRELPFLNVHRLIARIGVNVPAIYGHWETEHIILLEDLGDTALWDQVQDRPDDEVLLWYQKALDQLLILHGRGSEARDPSCIAFQQRFDAKLYLWEFEHFIEWGLEKRPGAQITAAAIASLRRTFADIAAVLERRSHCLSHRDYHSWNLMICGGAVRVIDFQDALLAPPQYDLASLLNDRITDSVVRPHLEESLVRYYIDGSRRQGYTIDVEEFFEIYRLSAIQRDLKVVGRFYFLDLVKGKPGYRKFIPPTARRLLRNLPQTPHTATILPLLEPHLEA
ncbi:MAG TPA: phosphotransferase, partial [Candidatus Binatia bacterium]|nr:phosphotransferase [Candidatus Binatia bacterium]